MRCLNRIWQPYRRALRIIALILATTLWLIPHSAHMEGTRTIYVADAPANAFRANLEWRTSSYGNDPQGNGLLRRRTLLKVYARAGEYILLGSSAVDVEGTPDEGDIRVYDPGQVTGLIGLETIPETPSFSCLAQRQQAGNEDRGRISSRAEELAGPNTDTNAIPEGYQPCFYQAPQDGIYDLVFWGPRGPDSDRENTKARRVQPDDADFGPGQETSVTAWDVTVRSDLSSTDDFPSRLFSYYFTLFTGGNGRPISGTIYIVTDDGFQYAFSPRRSDGNGFVFYSNQFGFINTDGTPLYRNVLADPDLPFQDQNQLKGLQGDITLQRPEYPIFLQQPDPLVLDALGISREAVPPQISNFTFTGSQDDDTTEVNKGGEFRFDSTSAGVFYVVISRDGTDFDGSNPQNRILRGELTAPGTASINWEGLDNTGTPFPAGEYAAKAAIQGGEVHFPSLDVENNTQGSQLTLINPPGGACPPWNGGCNGLFYDDRGYRTADGVLVGTAVNGPLCTDNVGDPPDILFSDPIFGFDSSTDQRRWGFLSGGNPNTQVCDPNGGFGDKKGLDQWTYYPSEVLQTPVRIIEPSAIVLDSFTAIRQASQIIVRWQTSAEIDTWGYNLYRSTDGTRATAMRMTPDLIAARGRGQGGAAYEWIDHTITPNQAYTYWLQEVEIDGTTIEYGPAESIAPAAQFRLMLPLVVH